MSSITKAVITAAGYGTRFLPATKATPKEMLPVVDKPAIQYVVEEAVLAGLSDVLVITGRGKHAIEDHFDRNFELEHYLEQSGKLALLDEVRVVNDLADMGYLTRRPDPADGRAKLIDLTKRGRDLMADAGRRVADIEHRWSALAGERNFNQMCRTMQRLLDELNPQQSRS